MQYSPIKDHQHHKWQQQKSWISYPDCQLARDKQQTQYRLTPKWKWKMLTNYWKFQNRNVQTYGFVYHDTNGQKHGPVWKTQSFLLSGNLYVHPKARLVWERQFEKVPVETWMGENSKLGMSLCTSFKRIILMCVCWWHKIGWKETKSWSDVDTT